MSYDCHLEKVNFRVMVTTKFVEIREITSYEPTNLLFCISSVPTFSHQGFVS